MRSSLRKAATAMGSMGIALGLAVAATGTAHAATWIKSVKAGDSNTDPGGRWATSWLTHSEGDGSYWIHFDPDGEIVSLRDSYADGHAAKGRVVSRDSDGNPYRDETFYAGTADGLKRINLDFPEGYSITVFVCINETTTCSPSAFGRA